MVIADENGSGDGTYACADESAAHRIGRDPADHRSNAGARGDLFVRRAPGQSNG
jgi:hypothetical protein